MSGFINLAGATSEPLTKRKESKKKEEEEKYGYVANLTGFELTREPAMTRNFSKISNKIEAESHVQNNFCATR